MSKRVSGSMLLVFGVVLGAIDAVIAFKPVENYWGQNCGSVLAPANAPSGNGNDLMDGAAFSSSCPASMEPFVFWSWALLIIAVTALVVGAALTASSSSQIKAGEGAADQASANGVGDQLQKLHSLRVSGVLTDEEFSAAKARLIRDGTAR
ncbi:SHOCT domain-containing protein [Cryobacterium sp. Y50]|uniref:SHOCT domain-containing protein n=1 Tax=Cryobacterium sp. Y50 TaxID=2048286 RepID=UPI001304C157|nr:SHOCT domain-containing protein [Cryobacterium sp. Y50]